MGTMGADDLNSVDDQILRLRRIIDSVPALIHIAQPDGYLDFFNQTWLEFIGQPLEKLLGWRWTAYIHPEDVDVFVQRFRESIAKGERFEETARVRRADGEYRWMLHYKVPRRDADGKVIEWFGSSMDIDERKRAEDHLRDIRISLGKASKIATVAELSASIAHELNQPLMSVLANAQAAKRWLAMNSPNLEEVNSSIDRILRDARAADETMQHIRKLFKQEPFYKKEASIPGMISEAIRLVIEDPNKHQVPIDWHFDDHLPKVSVDPIQIQGVFINLISNALEAIAIDGGVSPMIKVRTAVTNENEMLIQVIDNGPGVNDPEKIFDAFVTTKEKGMGIGLAVSRSIVEAHGGRIWAENNADIGATFSVALPLSLRD